MSAPELQLRYAYDAGSVGTLGLHVVKNMGNGAIAFIADDRAAAESWAARHNSPMTYGDISDRLGKSLVESMREHQNHAIDALRYALMPHPPSPPRPWLVRQSRALRWWLSCRLRDLSDWIAP